jgi:LemA protein
MGKGIIALIVIVIIVIVGIAVVAGIYNAMVQKQADVQNAWGQVENQFQRRADLIPNLVETVKGYAKQEETVLTEVTRLRSQWQEATTREAQVTAANELEGALGRLMVVVENYPDLKSSQNFLALQDELAGTENRVAVERKRYNDAVTVYNKYIRVWPNSMFAAWFGFKDETLFQAEAGAEQAPEVKF